MLTVAESLVRSAHEQQFRDCNLNQLPLLSASLPNWLPEGHLARFMADVVEALDLSAIYAQYAEGDVRWGE